MDTPNLHEKELVWLQVLYLYVTPVLLLYYGIVPGNFRIYLLFGVAILLYGVVKRAKWTYADMGIDRDWHKSFIPYAIFTLASIGFLIWLSKITTHSPMLDWWENKKFLLLFIPISVLQEVIFRGILMNMLKRAFSNPIFIIVLNAAVFALIHVIYLNATFVLPLTFIAGIGFAWIYYNYPNLIMISVAHTILNFTAMILGFFIVR